MNPPGDADLLVVARSVLLDALEALEAHRDAIILIGAQALYLHTGAVTLALAEATKDTDIAVDVRMLGDDPLLETAMAAHGFHPDTRGPGPGRWLNTDGNVIDLMVAEALAGPAAAKRRGARIPPHSTWAARRAVGLEAAMVDYKIMDVAALDPADLRICTIKVAGASALLVAKMHKIGERLDMPTRLVDKDAYDVHRLLQAVGSAELAVGMERLLGDELSAPVTKTAIGYLQDLFGDGPDAAGSVMAGRAEEGIGVPDVVSAQVAVLAAELLAALA